MFAIKDLTVAYQGEEILSQVSLSFEKGKITGVIGPNGAGKSTLIKGALGLIKIQSGQTFLDKQPLKKVRDQIAYVSQRADVDLTFPINVLDLVLTGTYPKLGLFKSPGQAEKAAAREALTQVGLADFQGRQIGSLSGGQLQRVFVARAIVQNASVVIMDEPFVGIDMASEQQIMTILKAWAEAGKTVIIVNHDLTKITQYFDDLLIIYRGIVAQGPVADVYHEAYIQKAYSADFGSLLFESTENGGEDD